MNLRKIKGLMFGRLDSMNRGGRSHRVWLDDVTEWGRASLQGLSKAAIDRGKWKGLVKMALDTYGE